MLLFTISEMETLSFIYRKKCCHPNLITGISSIDLPVSREDMEIKLKKLNGFSDKSQIVRDKTSFTGFSLQYRHPGSRARPTLLSFAANLIRALIALLPHTATLLMLANIITEGWKNRYFVTQAALFDILPPP